jgi:hypothetical protein
MRLRLVLASLAALLVAAQAARADEVVLKNGSSFAGTIVKDDAREVVIDCAGGRLTFERYQVASVKREPATSPPPAPAPSPAPAPAPAPAPSTPTPTPHAAPPKSGGSDARGGTAAAPAKSDSAKAPGKKTPADRLTELCSIRLTPWIEESSTPCEEPGAKRYKIVGADGATKMRDERPSSPDGIDAIYVQNDAMEGQAIEIRNGMRRTYWYRLYWHDATREWTIVHPDLEAFQKDCALAARIADEACKDETGRIGACIAEQSIAYALQKDRGSPAAKERAELRKCCAAATGTAAAGELLAQFHELGVEIGFARRPSEKIALAMKRRDVLRDLYAAVGR